MQPEINGYGDPQIPKSEIEEITSAKVVDNELGITINVRTDAYRSMRFYLEHKDDRKQAEGQEALGRLLRACAIAHIDSAEELIGHKIQWKWCPSEIQPGYPVNVERRSTNEATAPNGRLASHPTKGKYIYVVACADSEEPLCKIGIANSPEGRTKTLSTSSPHTLRLEFARYCSDARALESRAHADLTAARRNGEWFAMPAKDAIAYINRELERSAA